MMNVPSGKKPKPRICSLSLISSDWRPGVDIRSARSPTDGQANQQ